MVYGRPPPNLGEIRVQALAEDLRERDEILHHLQFQLEKAQHRMVVEANKHRREVEFKVGDWVFLKFRPYSQKALFKKINMKLAPRFFGPFQIVARVEA